MELSTLAQRLRARLERIAALAVQPEDTRNAIARLAHEALLDGLSIGCRVCGGVGKVVIRGRQGTTGTPCWCNSIMDQREVGLDPVTGLGEIAASLRNERIKTPDPAGMGELLEVVPVEFALELLAEVKRLRANGPASELAKLSVDSSVDGLRAAAMLCETIASELSASGSGVMAAGATQCARTLREAAERR